MLEELSSLNFPLKAMFRWEMLCDEVWRIFYIDWLDRVRTFTRQDQDTYLDEAKIFKISVLIRSYMNTAYINLIFIEVTFASLWYFYVQRLSKDKKTINHFSLRLGKGHCTMGYFTRTGWSTKWVFQQYLWYLENLFLSAYLPPHLSWWTELSIGKDQDKFKYPEL